MPPDNPHPHPPEFGASRQLFLVRLIEIINQRITSLGRERVSTQTNARYSTSYYARTPRD